MNPRDTQDTDEGPVPRGPVPRRYTLSLVTPPSGLRSAVTHASVQAITVSWGSASVEEQLRYVGAHLNSTLPAPEAALVQGACRYSWQYLDDRPYENDLILYNAVGLECMVQSLVGDFLELLPEGMSCILVHETAHSPFSSKNYVLDPGRSHDLNFSAWYLTLCGGNFAEKARSSPFIVPKVPTRKASIPERGPFSGTVEPQRSVRSSL